MFSSFNLPLPPSSGGQGGVKCYELFDHLAAVACDEDTLLAVKRCANVAARDVEVTHLVIATNAQVVHTGYNSPWLNNSENRRTLSTHTFG